MEARPQHTPAYRHLCDLLRQWRVGGKLTQRDLAAKLRKPPSHVHECKVGDRRIDLVELVYWCRACGVAPTAGVADLDRCV